MRRNDRITEWLGTEGTSKDHKPQFSPSLVELRNAYLQKLKTTTTSFNHWKIVGKYIVIYTDSKVFAFMI